MSIRVSRFRVLLLAGAAGALGSARAAEAPPLKWPVPAGWRSETIPFPLGFAPEVPYRGTEEVRFAPGFFQPNSDTFWTYAFTWWLEGEPDTSRKGLEGNLTRYFSGLCQAVGGKKYAFSPDHFRAKLVPAAGPARHGAHEAQAFSGTIETYDPFATGAALTLNVEAQVWDCEQGKHRVVLILASPKTRESAAWKELIERRDALACP